MKSIVNSIKAIMNGIKAKKSKQPKSNERQFASEEQNIDSYMKGELDYSNMTITEIKEQMNKRFEMGKAYEIKILWDEIRHEELISAVLEMSTPHSGKNILDMGCGTGGMPHYIHDMNYIIGTDISDVAIKQAKETFKDNPKKMFKQMDAQNLTFRNKEFDIVFAKEVIEHLPDVQKAIKEIYRVLKPGGLFVLTSPNRGSMHLQVNKILGYKDFKCSYDHIKEYTYEETVKILEDAGFTIKSSKGIFLMPYWGIPHVDQSIRSYTDNNPEMVELLRELGEIVGPKYSFCYAIAAEKKAAANMQHEGWEEYEPDLIEAFRPDNDEGISQYCRALRVANACEGDVIDVGAGDGFIANKIRERGHHVVAIDVSEKRVENIKKRFGLPAEVGNARRLDLADHSLDTVVMAELLEHFDNPAEPLSEAFRVAKKKVVITLPLEYFDNKDSTHKWKIRAEIIAKKFVMVEFVR